MENKENILKVKSYDFALRIVKLYKHSSETKGEYVLSKQILRSGTSIGANIAEANQAQSKADFIHKLSIAHKESFETDYWLCLLRDSQYLSIPQAGITPSRLPRITKTIDSFDKDVQSKQMNFPFSIFHFPLC